MYNLLGSHDTERFFTAVGEDVQKIKLAFLILFSLPGAPAIYYGDEIGLTGGPDPDCRGTFPWDESLWNNELHYWIKDLVRIRKDLGALRRGVFSIGTAEESNTVIIISRGSGMEKCITVVNPSNLQKVVTLSNELFENGIILKDLFTSAEFDIQDSKAVIDLKPWTGALMIPKR